MVLDSKFNFEVKDEVSAIAQLEKGLRAELTVDLRKEREILEQEINRFQLHKQRALELTKSQCKNSVKLNVGGTIFELSSTTINKFPNSTLALMFSGKWNNKKDENGAVILNRDPRVFSHIIRWMRSKLITVGPESELFELLLEEANFLGLVDLKKQLLGITGENYSIEEYEANWPADWLEMKKKEDHWRDVFVNDRQNTALNDMHLDLISIYDNLDQFFEKKDQVVPQVLKKHKKISSPLHLAVVSDLHEFQTHFDMFTSHQLQGIDWNNVIVAGGSVLACLMPTPSYATSSEDLCAYYHGGCVLEQKTRIHRDIVKRRFFSTGLWGSSDIDLFLYGLTPEQATKKVVSLYHQISANIPNHKDDGKSKVALIRTPNVISIIFGWPRRTIQIILRIYKSPSEVLMGFDVDSCCVAYDGSQVWTTSRGQRALTCHVNVADPTRQSPSYEFRLYKYSKRGFSVAVPGLNELQINYHDIYSKPFRQTNGLARLLLLDSKDLTDITHCTCIPRIEVAIPPPARRYFVARTLVFNHCLVHKGFLQRVSARCGNTDDRDESEFVNSSNATDYQSPFIPYGPGWNHYNIKALLTTREIKSVHPPPPMIVGTTIAHIMDNIHCRWWPTSSPEKIEWMTENPGTQLTGSFNPIHGDWFKQAYSKFHGNLV